MSGTEGTDQVHERSKMYVNTRYLINEAITEVRSNAIEQAINDIESMRPFLTQGDNRDNCLNDSDKAYLLRYYGQLLSDTSSMWNKIVNIVSHLREQELMSIVEEELSIDPPDSNAACELHPLELEGIQAVVHEAINIYRKDEKLRYDMVISRPKSKDLKQTEFLINQLREKKQIKESNNTLAQKESGDSS